MKKRAARLTAVVLSLIMCVTMAGCDVDFGAVLLVKKAYDAIMEVKSFRASATVEAVGLSGAKPVSLSAKAEGSCVVAPLAATLDAEFDLGPQGVYEVPMYMLDEGDNVALYIGARAGGCDIWIKKALDISIDAFSNAAQIVLRYMKDCTEPISRGSAMKINGKEAEPLSVVVPGDSLMKTDEKDQVIKGEHPIKNLRVTIWIDVETNLPVRIEADISELVQYYLGQMDVVILPAVTVESMPAVIELYDFDKVDAVVLPVDATVPVERDPNSIEAALDPSGKKADKDEAPTQSPASDASPSPEASPAIDASPSPEASPSAAA